MHCLGLRRLEFVLESATTDGADHLVEQERAREEKLALTTVVKRRAVVALTPTVPTGQTHVEGSLSSG